MEPTVKHLFRLSVLSLFLGAGFESAFMIGNFGPGGHEAFDQAARFLYLNGFAILGLCGFMYHMLPKLMGALLYSKRMVATHLGLATAGVALVVVALVGALTGTIPPRGLQMVAATGGLITDFGFLFAAGNLLLSFNRKAAIPGLKN